ncbi:MAG TPA: nucleotidyltransferase family protein [Hellea balneolensis]|uniref:Nucleotidyltransferase family protein n=1 Tax=Hellea balneolensis TaxID=287478 RepID=A0A7C3GME5_9PROT|nr:nucleotidyltransferase family protein [Hellea balneolensis]
MIMAAGMGTRMMPLTRNRCKAMVDVGGKPLIDHCLDRLHAAGIHRAVVNVHAFADDLEAHVRQRQTGPEIIISDERDELLDTGGALVKAQNALGRDPILICNIDALWVEFAPVLPTLMAHWDPRTMDELFLLAPREHSLGYDGAGDFDLNPDGQISWRAHATADFVYAGIEIFKPGLITGYDCEKFSRKVMWDKTFARNKAYGCEIPAYWMHVGDPRARKAAQAVLDYVRAA